MKKITDLTRRDIIDILKYGFYGSPGDLNLMTYNGRMSELDFLSRIYKLDEMPSCDNRFKNARGDIEKHTIYNDDWGEYWVFEDSRFQLTPGSDDEPLLGFLAEIFHPIVRIETQPWEAFLSTYNKLLKADGYELYEKTHISGRAVYSWREISSSDIVVKGLIEGIKKDFNSDYITNQADQMYRSINTAPHSAIGKAKELLESCCKTILDEQGISYENVGREIDLPQLMRLACDSIGLSPKKLKGDTDDTVNSISSKILGNLNSIGQGMAELRNQYGDGHGKNRTFKALPSRYADLAVGAAVTAVKFMWGTYQEKKHSI